MNQNTKDPVPLSQPTPTPYPTSVRYTAKENLDPETLGKLLLAGIKFFLCQRQQIPVPYERLYGTTSIGNGTSSNPTSLDKSSNYAHNLVPDSLENPMDRIRYMRNLRKKSKANKMASGRSYKSIREETRAKNTLDKVFDDINNLFRNTAETELKSLVLHFGASIYNPKETIIFQIHPQIGTLTGKETSSSNIPNVPDLTKITRTFYKNIIMSPLFPNFVEKPLKSTHTHIVLVTNNPLPDSLRMDHGLITLENTASISSKTFVNLNSSKTSKQFLINIEPEGSSKVFDHDLTSSQESSSYYYQFPLLFKGVRK